MIDEFSSIPSCEICFVTYDLEARIPRTMHCCGKALCRKCLDKMMRDHQNVKCPWCKCVHEAGVKFKTNFPLLEVIQENLKWEICAEHGEAIKLFCPQDKRKVCAYCQTLGAKTQCRDHDLVSLASLKPEVDKGREKFQNDLMMLDEKYHESNKKLVGNRKTMEEMICKYFDEQQHSLQASKIKMLHNFNIARDREKTKFDETFGKESSLRNELEKIILDHMNFLKNPDPKEIIDRDYSNLQNRLSYFISSNSNGLSFEQQLSQDVPKLEVSISKQSSTMMKSWDSFIGNVPKEILEEVPSDFENSRDDPDSKNDTLNFNSYLGFTIEDSSLIIKECVDEVETELSRNNLSRISRVNFIFESLDLRSEDWERISQVFAEVMAEYCLTIYFESIHNDYSINRLSRLFSIFFQQPEIIQGLILRLNFNDEIMQLLNLILPQLSILDCLELKIQDAEISLKHLNEFIENLHLIAPRLEDLTLDLSNMQLPLSIFKGILIKMPILKSFSLNASGIPNLSAKIISPLLDDSKNLMPQLEELVLDISRTDIPVSNVEIINNHFSHIKNLKFQLKDPESGKANSQAKQSQIFSPQRQAFNPFQSANTQNRYLAMFTQRQNMFTSY